jgi:uncharacterized membrane protein
MKKGYMEKLVMTGLMTALVLVVTAIFPIPVPFSNGYIHLGDSMIFLAVIILGWKSGAFAAAVGSALADIYLGFAYWAPWTFVIKGGMAFILGFIVYQAAKSKFGFGISSFVTIAFWLGFNFLVRVLINYGTRHGTAGNMDALMEESGTSNALELGEFIGRIEGWLMVGALTIPLLLIIISVYVSRSKHISLPLSQILGMAGSGIFMVFGYYVSGGLIYGNFTMAAFAMPFNILQFVVGFVIAVLVSTALAKTPFRKRMVFYTLTE